MAIAPLERKQELSYSFWNLYNRSDDLSLIKDHYISYKSSQTQFLHCGFGTLEDRILGEAVAMAAQHRKGYGIDPATGYIGSLQGRWRDITYEMVTELGFEG